MNRKSLSILSLALISSLFLMSCASAFYVLHDDQGNLADNRYLLPFQPGIYSGMAAGFLDTVHIDVEVCNNGRIVRIDVTRHNDTPGFANPAFEIMRADILEAQSTDIDLITGATSSSRAFREAVEDALKQSGVTLAQLRPGADPSAFTSGTVASEPVTLEQQPIVSIDNTLSDAALAALPVATANFTPGVHTITMPSWQDAPMTVQVSFSENKITGVEVLEHNDSMYGSGWALRALPGVPDQILVRQSTQDIDTFTGATITRNAVIGAVEEAIAQAGALPSQLTPQFIEAPLPGDRFIPGYVEINVPANTMDIYGNPLTESATRMLFSEDTDMNLRLSFGRNEFHLHSGGAFGLGQGGGGHGESVYEPDQVGGGALGGWWFRQVANHQVNDRQSTQGIDIVTGATMSASAIVWGVEQAMIAQGANPANITPITYPPTQLQRHPAANPTDPFFLPGIYTVIVGGWGGPMEVQVTLDRTNIRRINVIEHNETEAFWDMVWGAAADHVMRDRIFYAGAANIDSVDVVTGATASSNALINAVRAAIDQAWLDEHSPD